MKTLFDPSLAIVMSRYHVFFVLCSRKIPSFLVVFNVASFFRLRGELPFLLFVILGWPMGGRASKKHNEIKMVTHFDLFGRFQILA